MAHELTEAELAERRAAFEAQELEQVRANMRNFGEIAHPDDSPSHARYLEVKYGGTGLGRFLNRIEGKSDPVRAKID